MTRPLIIWIAIALVLLPFLMLLRKLTDEPIKVTTTPAPPAPDSAAPRQSRSSFPKDFVPPQLLPREFDYLPEHKREAVRQAEHDVSEETKRRITPGKQDAAGIQEMEKLHRSLEQRLSQILTPVEKFEYDVRDSLLAQMLISTLDGLHPTDAEFRAIYRHRNEFENRVAENPASIDSAWAECNEKVRASIGEERFKRYKIVETSDFIVIYAFFQGQGVEPEPFDKIYRTWVAAGEAANRIRLDDTLSTETKLQRLKENKANTMNDIAEILGTGPGSEKFKVRGQMNFAGGTESLKLRTPDKPKILRPQPGTFGILFPN